MTSTFTHRRSLTAAVGTVALIGALIGCGSSGSSSTKATTTTSTSTTTTAPTTAAPKADQPGKAGKANKAGKAKGAKAKGAKALLKDKVELDATAAQALGILPADLDTELQGGKSIAQVAVEHNVDLTKVTDALGADLTKRIDDAVAKGTLTTQQADQAKQRLPMTVDKFVNRQGGQAHGATAGSTSTPGTTVPGSAGSTTTSAPGPASTSDGASS